MIKLLKMFCLITTVIGTVLVATIGSAAPASEGRIMRGNPAAQLTIVEFTDFQCPYCASGARTVSVILEKYEGKVNLVVKHYPLQFHQAALPAALYFEGLAAQSPELAWKYYDAVFENPQRLNEGEDYLKLVAAGLGADMKQLDKDVRSTQTLKKIAADKSEFEQSGFDGVPVFIIDGKVMVGAQPAQKFIDVIDAILNK